MSGRRTFTLSGIAYLFVAIAVACSTGGDGGMTGPSSDDGTGGTASDEAPSAMIVEPEDGDRFLQGEEITFEGSADDPEDGTLSGGALVWESDLDGEIGTGATFATNALSPGEHEITLTATDSGSNTATASVSIDVEPVALVVRITSPPDASTFVEGEVISFAGSAEDEQDGALTGGSLVWDSSLDGQIGIGQSFGRSLTVGDHIVTLTATDSDGNTATASISVEVQDKDPSVRITSPSDGATFVQGDPIAFEGSGDDPQDGALTGAALEWDSDIDGPIGTGESFSRDDLSAGDHEITLTGIDGDGNTASASVSITVNPPPGGGMGYVYVANRTTDDISVIDAATNTSQDTIPVGQNPKDVAFSPDGSTAYVTYIGAVSVIDVAAAAETDVISVQLTSPWGVAVTPDGGTVYVTNASVSHDVSVIDAAAKSVTTTIAMDDGDSPRGVAFTPDGSTAYVANAGADEVAVIDVATGSVTTTIPVGQAPLDLAVAPDGETVYVTNVVSEEVAVIDVASNSVTTAVPVGSLPSGVAVTPDGETAYVANEGDDDVSVIDLTANAVTTTVPVGDAPRGVAVTPDGSTVYVTNASSNDVSVIDVATNSVVTTVGVRLGPSAVAVSP